MNVMSHGMNNSFGNIRLGDECIPDEEPPSEDFVCQLTEEWDWIFIPAKIINARKGDIILSPSGNGNIGGLLKQVSPPQLYSHSGLMIQNYYKLRHSTGSEDWLSDAAAGSFIIGDDKGSDGIDPEKLKYFWPGTIDQTIEAAFNGSDFEDPDKIKDDKGNIKKYKLQAFDNYPKLNGNSEIIYPVVVKPEPAIEAENPKIRELLHKVSEEGKKIKGHYRFYCYSEANISLQGFSDSYLAPDKGDKWWASKTLPTVCSSFIWSAIKAVPEIKLHLEGKDFFTKPSEIESTDVGAEVDFKTIDGLYYYRESERLAAALWLYNNFYDIAYDKIHEGIKKKVDLGIINGLFDWIWNGLSDASDDLANQVCNTFGFDWSGEDESGNHSKDSDRWKSPGDGRAVSPHNIKSYWDAPKIENDKLYGLYGYSENLVYRPARIEWRKISRWVKAEKKIKVKGYVKFRGINVANAIVKASGIDYMTNSNGYFEFETKISSNGNLLVEAGKPIDGLFDEGSIELNLNFYSGSDIIIELKEPPAIFREVIIRGAMKLKDEENWPESDEFATRSKLFGTIRLDDRNKHSDNGWTEKMGGEIRAEVRLKIDWRTDLSISVWCNVKLYEGTSEDTTDLDGEKTETHIIPKDATKEIKIFVRNDDENDDDHIDLSLIVSNNVQP